MTLLNGVSAHSQGSSPGGTSPGASISTYDDCTEINIQYQYDGTLTREEFITTMDAAFFESLNKFDACQANLMNSSAGASGSSGTSGMGAGGFGENGGDGSSGGSRAGSTTASSEVSGTESTSSTTSATAGAVSSQEGLSGKQPARWNNPDANRGQVSSYRKGTLSGRGKAPEDIPSADNDSVLEAQIRQAAENETDPEIKKKLWDEYRKYKGLPRTAN